MDELICGFQVVKKVASFMKIEPYNKLANIVSTQYQGLSRMHLYDMIEDYYNRMLPKDLTVIVKSSFEENNDLSLEIIRNFDDALKILDFTNAKISDNEIISLKSETLQRMKGSFIFDKKEIEWLGFDVISYGYGSLILDGIFMKHQYFEDWLSILNHNGLFNSNEHIKDFIAYYTDCSKRNIVEQLPFSNYGFDTIEVGRVII